MKKILFIAGTRPEIIKLAPVYFELKKNPKLEILLGLTGQHKELKLQALDFFGLESIFNLDLMLGNQSLNTLMASVMADLDSKLRWMSPDYILVQGDTTTVFGASLAAYHNKIKIMHLEAGLRTHDKYAPFPEEMNRQMTSTLADIHFAPTKRAADNLISEGITEDIHIVGNTVIDALFMGLDRIESSELKQEIESYFSFLDFSKKVVLMTCHRRENFGNGLLEIMDGVKQFASDFKDDVQICFPVHPNPNIEKVVREQLSEIPNIYLTEPLSYPYLIWLMKQCFFVLTDSGGMQEEAPSLKKPVLVLRDKTERVEAINGGQSVLLGSNKNSIVEYCSRLMSDENYYRTFIAKENPYGDGKASARINRIINECYL